MEKLIIEGGRPLKGEVELCGAKNSGFKLMIAALYADSPSKILNFSKIGDIYSTGEIIKELGGKVEFGENHVLAVSGENLKRIKISEKEGKISRASTYFVGPLIYRFGQAIVPIPGGCQIGKRPIDRHLEGFKALGTKITNLDDKFVRIEGKLKGGKYKFPKNTHGGTDVLVIAAAAAEGNTILENAAEEPEIDDLISFLNKMGAKIKRIAPRKIFIEGVKKFSPTIHSIMPDRNEAVTFACAALATKGDIFVKKANPDVLSAFLKEFRKTGGEFTINKEGIRFFYLGPLKSTNIVTRPYPGFMTDWMSIWAVLMTQAKGMSIIHETIFENRFAFVEVLKQMGARIDLFNPPVRNPEKIYNFNLEDDRPEYFHAAKIYGPASLKGIKALIPDIRAGASMVLAALTASDRSEFTGIEHIDRGYENLDKRFCNLGADIKRVSL